MLLSIDGVGEVSGNTDEYLLLAPGILSFLNQQIALFPGDVVTLGRISNLITIPAEKDLAEAITLHASIEGIGEVRSPVRL